MKKIAGFILFFITFSIASAQNPFHDAIFLADSATINNGVVEIDLNTLSGETEKIFSKYLAKDLSIEDQFNIVNKNPFITMLGNQQSGLGFMGGGVSKALDGFGSLNVTNIADGLAKFLVERTKQELSVAFFERFNEELSNQKQLQILFPSTYKTLSVIGDEIYMFSIYIEMLRQSFQKDLATLLTNVQKLVNDDSMLEAFAKHPELKTIISDGIYLSLQLKDGNHIGDVFNSYIVDEANPDDLNKINENLYPSMALLNILSQSIRSEENETRYWISRDNLKKLDNKKALKIYFGLLYQQIWLHNQKKGELKIGEKNILDLLKKGAESVAKLEELKKEVFSIITPIIEMGRVVDAKFTQIRNLQKQPDVEPGYQEYFELLDASLNFVETTKTTYINISGKTETEKFDEYLSAARSLGNIYVDINQKQYVSAISELAFIYNGLILETLKNETPLDESIIKKRTEFVKALERILKDDNTLQLKSALKELVSNYKNELPPITAYIVNFINNADNKEVIELFFKNLNITDYEAKLIEQHEDIIKFLIKYGNFVALVAKAENSDQVKEAIEAVALPAGSASIKKKSAFNVSLNAYMGLFYGNEYLEDANQGWGDIYGLSAPIGIAASWGLNKKVPLFASISLYGSLVDIGAVASYRFKDDEAETLPEIKLQNIFAPGLYGILGFKSVPVSVGYGWQRGPELRQVNVEDPANPGVFLNETASGYRWSVFIGVDIPLVNFYTKSK
jgi:hypothetical protein